MLKIIPLLTLLLLSCGTTTNYGFELQTPVSAAQFETALFQLLHVRMQAGNEATLCNDGAVFDMIEHEVKEAKSSVHFLGYIWEKGEASDRVIRALTGAVRRGVACRVVIDAFGSPHFMKEIAPSLIGCEIHIFRPLIGGEKIPRNHRKIVIVDGKSAIIGGWGVRDEWLGAWRDSNVRIAGPVVTDIQQSFSESLLIAGGGLLPDNAFPTLEKVGNVHAAFIVSSGGYSTSSEKWTQLAVSAAEKRLWIANPYFVPSTHDRELMMQRAKAKVDVRLLTAGAASDSKMSFIAQQPIYGPLMKNGVRVWEFNRMMHAKTMVIDDDLVFIGSNNLDPLSLKYLDDDVLIMRDQVLAKEMTRDFEHDLTEATAR